MIICHEQRHFCPYLFSRREGEKKKNSNDSIFSFRDIHHWLRRKHTSNFMSTYYICLLSLFFSGVIHFEDFIRKSKQTETIGIDVNISNWLLLSKEIIFSRSSTSILRIIKYRFRTINIFYSIDRHRLIIFVEKLRYSIVDWMKTNIDCCCHYLTRVVVNDERFWFENADKLVSFVLNFFNVNDGFLFEIIEGWAIGGNGITLGLRFGSKRLRISWIWAFELGFCVLLFIVGRKLIWFDFGGEIFG